MHLLFDISAHGLGHLAQSAPVINALRALAPGLELTVRSAIPRERLALRIAGDFRHVAEARDFGLVMHNAVDIDLDASAARYREFHADWPRRVAAEAEWLRRHGVDALVSNVAYLPLAAATEAGIPACGLCSLNWAEMFAHYLGREPWAGDIHAQILAAYSAGKAFLRITPGLAMADLPARCDIAPIASIGHHDRERIAKALAIDESERWLLLAMGGMEFRLPVEDWAPVPGVKWLVPGAWGLTRSDVRSIDVAGLDFIDLLASVDAVVSKPGYGTFVEAACSGVPLLYVDRDDWPETPHFAAWLALHSRAARLSRERLLGGDFIEILQALWRAPAPTPPPADGAAQAARWLVREFQLA
jgi:hypothetical protein